MVAIGGIADKQSQLALPASAAIDPQRTRGVRRSIRFGHPICDALVHVIDVDQFVAFGMSDNLIVADGLPSILIWVG
jgi:hypothetical protein